MGFQHDPFGHRSYEYTPTWGREIERNPDKQPSYSDQRYAEHNGSMYALLEVRGLGVLMMRVSEGHADGRLRQEGLAIFTREELMFD